MGAEVEIVFPVGDVTIGGSHPLVMLGPNGSGKTRLARYLRVGSDVAVTRISAMRNLQLPQEIQIARSGQAKEELDRAINHTQNQPWVSTNDMGVLIAALVAEDAESATQFRNAARTNVGEMGRPPETSLTRTMDFWHRMFPGRLLDLSSHKPQVTSLASGDSVPYPANQMSDGERVAVYLAARVLHTAPGLVIVDEPEFHLHSLLARQLWSGLEELRSDCRFVYITHDIAFATSRRGAQYIIVRPDNNHDILPQNSPIPDDVLQAVLGAASFSATSQRVVFCEGVAGGDDVFYQAWFDPKTTAVVPVGSCAEVVKCVTVVNSGKTVRGVKAVGIVDGDYWPDSRIANLERDGVHVLRVHEIESLFCFPNVHRAIAEHVAEGRPDMKYREFIQNARARFEGTFLHKQALERTKKAIDAEIVGILNRVTPKENASAMRDQLVDATSAGSWGFNPGTMFDSELAVVNAALSDTAKIEDFLRVFPGKTYLDLAAKSVGLTGDRYRELICTALQHDDTPPADKTTGLAKLKADIVSALTPHLPAREAT